MVNLAGGDGHDRRETHNCLAGWLTDRGHGARTLTDTNGQQNALE